MGCQHSEHARISVAAAQGDANSIVRLLERDPSAVDVQDARGCTILLLAAQNGHAEIVRTLLTRFGSQAVDTPNPNYHTPLYFAAQNGHAEVVRALLELGRSEAVDTPSEHGVTPVYIAAQNGHVEVLRSLLATDGGRSSADSPAKNEATPLYAAAANGHVEVIRLLLKEFNSGAVDTPMATGATPLFIAAHKGHAEVVRLLLGEGASQAFNTPSQWGRLPLMSAVSQNRVDIADELLRAGADPHKMDSSEEITPAEAALKNGPLTKLFMRWKERHVAAEFAAWRTRSKHLENAEEIDVALETSEEVAAWRSRDNMVESGDSCVWLEQSQGPSLHLHAGLLDAGLTPARPLPGEAVRTAHEWAQRRLRALTETPPGANVLSM